MTILFMIKPGSNRIKILVGVVFWNVSSHVNEKEKKLVKILKKEKSGLEMWQIGSFP